MNPVILCKQVSEELCKFISTEMRIMEGVIQELDPQSIRQEPEFGDSYNACLLYTSPSPRDRG